jgi:predicted transcriptional regulator
LTASTLVEPAGRARKRDKPRIFHDILASIIQQEREEGGVARITHVQNEVNLPSDRLRVHVREMSDLGLIEYGKTLASTEKGRRFMAEYQKIVDTLQQFGLL